ncbi:hypothetical protein SPRA44_140137 [Serratia proteamaculans]|nr:hypothetical protein SPRA44_140137 [Serratia proteamaculans]
MGGADAILKKAKTDFDQGNYRWVAQIVSKIVFADPKNQDSSQIARSHLKSSDSPSSLSGIIKFAGMLPLRFAFSLQWVI